MTGQPLIKFNPKLPKLTKNEQAVLKLLIEAGELISPLYLEQENLLKSGNNFYPKGVSRTEIDRAAKKDPDILSPFTVIEKVNGELKSIPYHIKYVQFLKPVAERLIEAAELSENKEFSKFLKLKAKVLLEGLYEQSIAARRKMKPYILDIYIGPVQHHDDRLFYAKASYQAWVGVVDAIETEKTNYYKNLILSTKRRALLPKERLENYDRVRAKVIDVLLFSGHMARTKFVGVNLPMNVNWVAKYGSEITLFKQVNDLRLKEQILPTFNKIFELAFRKGFNTEDLRRGNARYITLHEMAHNYLYYKNAARNLRDLLSPIYELAATILGLKMAGSLLLKDVIDNKQLESMIVAFICRSYYLVGKSKESKFWANYALGGTIFINFLIKSGALKQYKGLTIPNFMKIFISLNDLFDELEQLLSLGSRKDAEGFIKKYGQFNI